MALGGWERWVLVVNHLAATALLGSVMLTMVFGHWYLVIPRLSIDPLVRLTKVLIGAIGLRVLTIVLSLIVLQAEQSIPLSQCVERIDDPARPVLLAASDFRCACPDHPCSDDLEHGSDPAHTGRYGSVVPWRCCGFIRRILLEVPAVFGEPAALSFSAQPTARRCPFRAVPVCPAVSRGTSCKSCRLWRRGMSSGIR